MGTNTIAPPRTPRGPRRAAVVVVAVAVIVLLALGGFVAYVLVARNAREIQEQPEGFERYRPAWESVMRKTGVEATYPAGPVDLEGVEPSGQQSFSATFTEEEIGALLAVYRYRSDSFGGRLQLDRISVTFPEAGIARLLARVRLEGDTYNAQVEAPASYTSTGLLIDQSAAKLSVEGFSVGGKQREEAVRMVSEYLESMLEAAPGLTVERAEIVEGGVRVEGMAPQRIEHPEPLPSDSSGAVARLPRG